MLNVADLQQILNYFLSLPARQILIVVIISSAAMTLLTDHRISTASLLLQYLLLPQLLSGHLHQNAFITRLVMGPAICVILYLTADHLQRAPRLAESVDEQGTGLEHETPKGMSLAFRTLTLMLGALVARSLWRRYPLPPVAPELTLASYWVMIAGILLALVGLDPLRIGFGLLSFVNGFVGLYLFWEPGFLVTGLLNVVEVLLTVGIVLFAESWLYAPATNARSGE